MSKIRDHFPKKESKEIRYVAVQGYVPKKLREDALAKMKRERDDGIKITWDIFLESCLKRYLDE